MGMTCKNTNTPSCFIKHVFPAYFACDSPLAKPPRMPSTYPFPTSTRAAGRPTNIPGGTAQFEPGLEAMYWRFLAYVYNIRPMFQGYGKGMIYHQNMA